MKKESLEMKLERKFKNLEIEHAPGQEIRQNQENLNSLIRGKKFAGIPVDFSHGDVDAFPPIPGSDTSWKEGYKKGAVQAYTEYRGLAEIRNKLAERLGKFTGSSIAADSELIITPGTQGALFLALGVTVNAGMKVAVIEPDYFANRKLVKFFDGEVMPIPLHILICPTKIQLMLTASMKYLKMEQKFLFFLRRIIQQDLYIQRTQ